MKIRSIQELADALDGNLAMRRRELTTYRLLVSAEKGSIRQGQYLRGAICLLYAHWEGFVKLACNCYVNYVSGLGLHMRDLSAGVLAVGLRAKFAIAVDSSILTNRIALIDTLLSAEPIPADLPASDAVNMEANLTSRVLRGVIGFLDADYRPYATKEKLVDHMLIERRNAVAHGELESVDVSEFSTLHSEVLTLLSWIQTDVLNAATLNKYRR
jgi:hypothetical protein